MRRVVIAVVVLVGLFVAVDFGTAAYAESAVSRQMRDRLALHTDPSVRINGFPFLTQAIVGRYSSVDISAPTIAIGGLPQLEVRAHLEGVRAALSELVDSVSPRIRVDRATGTVRIGPQDLERLVPGRTVTNVRIENVDAATLRKAAIRSGDMALASVNPERSARLLADYTVLGRTVEISTIAVLRLDDDGQVSIEPRDLQVAGSGIVLPSVAQAKLRDLLSVRVAVGDLPLGIKPDTFNAATGSLEISGTTTGLVLGGGTTDSG